MTQVTPSEVMQLLATAPYYGAALKRLSTLICCLLSTPISLLSKFSQIHLERPFIFFQAGNKYI